MSRSKKLGSIYANNRKRRVVSDDEHSEDEFFVENTNHNASTEAMKRNDHHENAGIGHKKLDPVERCQAKLRSLRQHLAILRHEAAEVEKEIARWEWEAAAAVKAAKLRSREAERASARNGHMHGYAMSGTGTQKRRRVLHHLDEDDDDADAPWGPAGASKGSRIVQEWLPAAVKNAADGTKRSATAWEHAMDEEDDDHDDDHHHGAVEIDDMDMAMEHDTDEDSGASAWGKLIDSVPSPRQDFEVVIGPPPSTLPVHKDKQPVVSGSETPLFFGSSSDDFTENESSPKPTLPANPIELLSSPPPSKTTNLCFSPLALSAPPPTNSIKDTNPNQTFSPLSLLPSSTPMRMATRPRPPSDSSFESSSGAAESITPPPHQLITPKRPATTAVSPSSNPNPQSAGKSFVPSPGFFGTYDERRKRAGLEPLPRVEFDEFEGGIGIARPQVGLARRGGEGSPTGKLFRMGWDAVPGV